MIINIFYFLHWVFMQFIVFTADILSLIEFFKNMIIKTINKAFVPYVRSKFAINIVNKSREQQCFMVLDMSQYRPVLFRCEVLLTGITIMKMIEALFSKRKCKIGYSILRCLSLRTFIMCSKEINCKRVYICIISSGKINQLTSSVFIVITIV